MEYCKHIRILIDKWQNSDRQMAVQNIFIGNLATDYLRYEQYVTICFTS